MDGYSRGGHTKYSMMVHLIFVTKYRKQILYGDMADDVKQLLFESAQKHGYRIIQMETDKDHVHLLVGYSVNTSVSEMAKNLKQYSTYGLWKRHEKYLRHHYWERRFLWSDGYFACSIGQVSQKTIEMYIANQG